MKSLEFILYDILLGLTLGFTGLFDLLFSGSIPFSFFEVDVPCQSPLSNCD